MKRERITLLIFLGIAVIVIGCNEKDTSVSPVVENPILQDNPEAAALAHVTFVDPDYIRRDAPVYSIGEDVYIVALESNPSFWGQPGAKPEYVECMVSTGLGDFEILTLSGDIPVDTTGQSVPYGNKIATSASISPVRKNGLLEVSGKGDLRVVTYSSFYGHVTKADSARVVLQK